MCSCNSGTFGIVKDGCQTCESTLPGSIECLGGSSFSIASNFYPYRDMEGLLSTELCLSNPDLIPAEVNPCPSAAALESSQVFNGNPDLCRNGATGRKCSECICSTNENEPCYFKRSHYCAKCSANSAKFKRSALIAMALLLVMGVVVTTLVLFLVVKRRLAIGDEGQFIGLPIGFFGILRFAAAHGILKVVIQFVQFSSQLTDWSGAINAYFLRLTNFDVSGFGWQCVFRNLSRPVDMFLLKVSVSFAILGLLWICIGLAAVAAAVSKFVKQRRRVSVERDSLVQGEYEEPVDVPQQKMKDGSKRINQFTRLGVSLSLTITNLFYFGVSTAIISAFFSDRQLGTGNVFMGTHPYIPWDDARAKQVRVVAALFFFFVPLVPIGTLVLLILFRNRLENLKVKSYIGTLFHSYRPTVFWWEMIFFLRKFLVASFSSMATQVAVRDWLVCSCLGAFLMLQLLVRPWKRRVENLVDEAASVVLIIAVIANMKRPFSEEAGKTLLTLARVFMLVFVLVAAVIWIWSIVVETHQYRKRMLEEYDHSEKEVVPRFEMGGDAIAVSSAENSGTESDFLSLT